MENRWGPRAGLPSVHARVDELIDHHDTRLARMEETVQAHPGTAARFEVTGTEGFVVPGTTSLEEYLKGLAPKQRAAIRRGASRGLSAGPSTPDEITGWFPERAGGAYARQGIAADYSVAAARALAVRLAGDPRLLWRTVRGVAATDRKPGCRVYASLIRMTDHVLTMTWGVRPCRRSQTN